MTSEASKVQQTIAANGNVDFAPYFDFWFGDSIASASTLLDSNDDNVHNLAQCLIDHEKAILESKKGFLDEMKRLGVQPKH